MKKLPLLKCGSWLLGLTLLLYACQPETVVEMVEVEVTRVVTETVVEEGEVVEVTRVVAEAIAAREPEGDEAAAATAVPANPTSSNNAPASQVQPQRLIIKDGRLTVVVDDTETAVNSATNLIVELGGYIISQNIHDDTLGYRFAAMRLAVPVTQFEFAMQALRDLGQVTNESSSGEDVTDEFVDLNSRLTNLELTRDRLRSFLDEAENVTETLTVNDELKQVEEEIAIIQGRINFLRDRSAFSTIDLNIQPWIPTPTATATATATPTPTATPLPTAEVWRPGDTVQVAAVRLQDTAQHTADFTIYNSIVCGPWLLLFLLIGFPTWRLARRLGLIEGAQERIVSHTNRNDVRHVVTGHEEDIEEEDDEQS
jgi:hypothetical protein